MARMFEAGGREPSVDDQVSGCETRPFHIPQVNQVSLPFPCSFSFPNDLGVKHTSKEMVSETVMGTSNLGASDTSDSTKDDSTERAAPLKEEGRRSQ